MSEYGGFKPQDDLGHSLDNDDISDYHPGMGAMVAMGCEFGYEGGPEFEGFEAFDMSHTWSPNTLPGMPHGPFDEPDKMGWEHERYQRRSFWDRLFGHGVGWKDEFGQDADPEDIPIVEDYVTEEYVPYGPAYGYRPRRAAGWAAWQRPLGPAVRYRRR